MKTREQCSVRYVVRITPPLGDKVDFVSTLDGFKHIGDMLLALHEFAGNKLYATDTEKLKEVLTEDFIKNFVKLGKSGRFTARQDLK
jgi:hypothetical protein